MARLVFRVGCVVALVCAAAVAAVRAQPRDDGLLRAFLMPPEDCPAPCWQGVRPGTMTLEHAERILDAHPWVAETLYADRIDSLFVRWNGMQSPFIRERGGFITARADALVDGVMVFSNIPFGEFILIFGQPETLYQLVDSVVAEYPAAHLEVTAKGKCPASPRELWTRPTEIHWTSAPIPYERFGALTINPREGHWMHALFECGGTG